MEQLYILHPEVAGGLGDHTIIINKKELESGISQIPEITQLEYVFEGWLGDELLESFPCFIITESLGERLKTSGLSGFKLLTVKITVSDTFQDLYPRRKLPDFFWLKPEGIIQFSAKHVVQDWSGHDFCLTKHAELVVTKRALEVLKKCKLENCKIVKLKLG